MASRPWTIKSIFKSVHLVVRWYLGNFYFGVTNKLARFVLFIVLLGGIFYSPLNIFRKRTSLVLCEKNCKSKKISPTDTDKPKTIIMQLAYLDIPPTRVRFILCWLNGKAEKISFGSRLHNSLLFVSMCHLSVGSIKLGDSIQKQRIVVEHDLTRSGVVTEAEFGF